MCEIVNVNDTKKPLCGLTEGGGHASQTKSEQAATVAVATATTSMTTKLNIHQDIYAKLAHFVESKSVTSMLWTVSGKRTIVIDFLRMIYPSARKTM